MKYKIITVLFICLSGNAAFCQESKLVLLNPDNMISKKTSTKVEKQVL
jgi:hypothetical protein